MSYEFGKILVIQQKMIGDVLTSTVLLEVLREKYPKAKLHYLVNSHTVPVVENNPFVDKLVLYTPEMEKNKSAFFRFLKAIRKEKYAVVIDVYGKISSNLICLFSGAPIKIGPHKKYTAFLYSDTIHNLKKAKTPNVLAVENRLRLLTPLGIEKNEKIHPKIYLTKNERSEARQLLLGQNIDFEKPLAMIALLGSSDAKTYPFRHMAQLLDFIVEKNKNIQLIFNYLPAQKEKASTIFERCQEKTKKRIWFDLYANGLRKFLAVVSQCDVLIGNEGGAVNMAKALQIPTFAIFSPWIRQEAWGSLHDPEHIGVHLKNYRPELFENPSSKKIKKEQESLYAEFSPELFQDALSGFLNAHVQQQNT